MTRLLALVGAIVITLGCAPQKIPGTEIDDIPSHRAVYDVVERYRIALEERSADGLLAIASPNYYEDSGTQQTEDDYGYDGLRAVLEKRFKMVQAFKMELQIKKLVIKSNKAQVEYRYFGRFQLAGKKSKVWHRKVEDNRLDLERLNGRWLIQAGM